MFTRDLALKRGMPIDRKKDGWRLMCYQQLPLGWIKRIATRFNNYYPLHWRIRMELPGELGISILSAEA